jgi:hypothetical protein
MKPLANSRDAVRAGPAAAGRRQDRRPGGSEARRRLRRRAGEAGGVRGVAVRPGAGDVAAVHDRGAWGQVNPKWQVTVCALTTQQRLSASGALCLGWNSAYITVNLQFFLFEFRGKFSPSLGPASVAGRPKHMSPCVQLASDPPRTTPPLLNLPVTVVASEVM